VLDPDHRGPLGVDPADDVYQHGDLGIGEAARHLVEEQQGWPGRDGAGDLQALALQQAESAGRSVRFAGYPG
jgi:hypothetical protein